MKIIYFINYISLLLKMNNKLILESQIQKLIYDDNKCTTHLKYRKENTTPRACLVSGTTTALANIILEIITINPNHDTQFLLGTFTGNTDIQCLEKALEFINNNKKKNTKSNSYTVEWYKKNEAKTVKSYFYAESIETLMKKFNYDKIENDYTIFSIKLNPIS